MKKFIHFFSTLRASALSPSIGGGWGEVVSLLGRAGVGWRALALCALALSPSFGGGWGEVVAQVNLTLSAPLTQGGTVAASSSITLKPGFRFAASPGNSLTLKIVPNASTPYGTGIASLSQDQNYVLTRTYKTDNEAGYMDQIQYFDGLGRPVQTVQPGTSPSGADLVTYQEYDPVGRESNAWLPRPAASNNGGFVPLASFKGLPSDGYQGDGEPYSYLVYEPSPLNRVQQQFGPGQEWHANGKSVKTEQLSNITNYGGIIFIGDDPEHPNSCILFEVGAAGLINKGKYPEAQLFITGTTDEGGSVSYEFKDKLGQVILTRQFKQGVFHDTYYVYDDFGNKRYVLPPIAVDSLSRGLGDDSDMMKKYAYVYKYDGRNRCIQKRIPGCDWTYYVYDKADRLALTQDGIQRPDFKWTVYKYDKLGRMLYSSEVTDIRHMTSFEEWLESFKGWLVTEDFGVPAPCYPMDSTGYTRGFFRQPEYYPTRLLSVNYYDDYRFLELLPDAAKTALGYTHEAGFDTRYENAKGLVTGGRQYQLDDSTKYTVTATYYDYRGRIVQTKSTNHLGGIEAEYIAYDFTGHPTQKKHVHTSPQAGTVTELYTYVYDHAGRPTETRHSLNSGAEQLLAKLSYDELGRVQNRKAGNSSVVNTTYGYNVRSWTTGINGSKFKEELAYNYDGNIKRQTFGDNSSYSIRYDFLYDDLSRLTDATSSSISGSYGTNDAYGCHYRYDKQGNATNITTNGTKWVTDRKTMLSTIKSVNYDALALAYNGNQLRKVSDAADVSTNSITEQFLEFARTDIEYAYNANGAMTKDLNKGISNISYNLLNLPQQIDILSPLAEARNNYSYSADGVKLRVVKKYNSTYNASPIIGSAVNTSKLNVTQTTDYVDGKIFENNVLDRIFVDGGYIKGGVYYFYETDHLGDNRTVINQSGTVVERNDYYPFGMQMAHNQLLNQASGSDNKRKFSGKELDVMGGLNTYDFEARPYDLNYINFWTSDPLAEDNPWISPYVYCSDSPVNRVDPDGRSDFDKVVGFVAAFVDNALGGTTNIRSHAANHVTDAKDFNTGLTVGDVTSLVIGGAEAAGGSGMVQGGTAAVGVGTAGLTAGGSGAVVIVGGVATTAAGAALAGHGAVMMTQGSKNLAQGKGHLPENKNGTFNGKQDTQNKSSREALRNAKDQNGIPKSQQPDNTTKVREKGTGKLLKQYEYTNSKGEKVQIRKDNPKTYPDGGTQGNHYNAGNEGEKLKQHHNYSK